jgi:hypothetical protein
VHQDTGGEAPPLLPRMSREATPPSSDSDRNREQQQ